MESAPTLGVANAPHYALDLRRQGEAVVCITPEGRVILRGQEIDMRDDATMAEAMRAIYTPGNVTI